MLYGVIEGITSNLPRELLAYIALAVLVREYTEKMQVTREIFHGISRESVA